MDVRLGGDSSGPCAGFRVLDFTTVVSGPLCTMILGDLGAEVTKIESMRGDATRMMGPPFRDGGLTPIFAQFNRNKRSLALDLKRPEAAALVRRLATVADAVVQNFRPGVVERLGIDYTALSRDNPGLVYVSITGFGPDGPYAEQPAYDSVIQGYTGHMPLQGGRGGPTLIRSLAADKASALTATWAILAALLARERNGGRGQLVDVPMLDAFAAYILPDALLHQTFLPAEGAGVDFSVVHRTWETADGHVVIMFVEDAQFAALCRVLEREDLLADQRYANFIGRITNWQTMITEMEAELRKWPTAELVARAHRFRAPLAPVNSVEDFLADPQVAWNRTVFEAEHPHAGPVRYLRNPARLPASSPALRRHPPRLGEHTDELLREAGFADEEISSLRRSGVIA